MHRIPSPRADSTYANTGKTQTINFTVHDVDSSSIHLLGEGASDTFDIELGAGTFGNITVNDSDSSTEHPLTVGLHGRMASPRRRRNHGQLRPIALFHAPDS